MYLHYPDTGCLLTDSQSKQPGGISFSNNQQCSSYIFVNTTGAIKVLQVRKVSQK